MTIIDGAGCEACGDPLVIGEGVYADYCADCVSLWENER